MKNYLTAGIGISRLARLVRSNTVSLHPRYLFRLLFLIQSAVWTELFSWIEKKRYGKKLAIAPVPDDPIFIIGHWRTGTTLLHQLLNLDPDLSAPSLFQVAEPDCFMTSYRYYVPVFSALLSDKRPMDNVKLGMNEPQEDEYAIYRITDFSPIERIVFPKNRNYFLLDCPSFLPGNEKEIKEWFARLLAYYRKLHFFHGKTIVSKNPFNSMRIRELSTLFPKARFIHIVRHPCEVVPSTVHMWKIVMAQNKLNNKGSCPGIEEVVNGLERVLKIIETDRLVIPEGRYYEMRFEDLEADPVEEFRKMYSRFNMNFDPVLSRNIKSFMDNLKNYKKNVFHLHEEEKEMICKKLEQHMGIFNYH